MRLTRKNLAAAASLPKATLNTRSCRPRGTRRSKRDRVTGSELDGMAQQKVVYPAAPLHLHGPDFGATFCCMSQHQARGHFPSITRVELRKRLKALRAQGSVTMVS
jgi:hypothetical protein